jgi:hypothetical protein
MAAEDERPRWTAFYGPAELDHVAAIILNSNGQSVEAEAMAHGALAKIPAGSNATAYARNWADRMRDEWSRA